MSVLFLLTVGLFAALRTAVSARLRTLSFNSSPFHTNMYSIIHSVYAFQLAFSNSFVSRVESWKFFAFRIKSCFQIYKTPDDLYISCYFLLGVYGFNYYHVFQNVLILSIRLGTRSNITNYRTVTPSTSHYVRTAAIYPLLRPKTLECYFPLDSHPTDSFHRSLFFLSFFLLRHCVFYLFLFHDHPPCYFVCLVKIPSKVLIFFLHVTDLLIVVLQKLLYNFACHFMVSHVYVYLKYRVLFHPRGRINLNASHNSKIINTP